MAIFFVRLQAIFFVCVAIVAEQFFYRLIYKKCICIASHINVISIQQSNQQQNLLFNIELIKIFDLVR